MTFRFNIWNVQSESLSPSVDSEDDMISQETKVKKMGTKGKSGKTRKFRTKSSPKGASLANHPRYRDLYPSLDCSPSRSRLEHPCVSWDGHLCEELQVRNFSKASLVLLDLIYTLWTLSQKCAIPCSLPSNSRPRTTRLANQRKERRRDRIPSQKHWTDSRLHVQKAEEELSVVYVRLGMILW